MVVGILVGTYSTIFIAMPLVIWWYGRQEKARGAGQAKAEPCGSLTSFTPRGNPRQALSVNRIRGRRGGNDPATDSPARIRLADRVLR